jgi:LysM repeat protein
VRSGDTMTAIAARFGTTVAEISALNNIANPSLIRVGQVLKLP